MVIYVDYKTVIVVPDEKLVNSFKKYKKDISSEISFFVNYLFTDTKP